MILLRATGINGLAELPSAGYRLQAMINSLLKLWILETLYLGSGGIK